MKFRRLELIRHRNGTAEFEVVAALSPEGMYVLRKVGESPLYSLADTLVDSMYVKMFPLDDSSVLRNYQKVAALAVGYGAKPDVSLDNFVNKIKFVQGRGWVHPDGESIVLKCSAILDTPSVNAAESAAARNYPSIVSPASDVAVSLRGIPAGYYLKSFRKTEPGDLVLNTSGFVTPAKAFKGGVALYRPIVGEVSSLNASNHPFVEGIPRGWRMVAYRKPVSGEYCIRLGGSEVFQCEEGDWACVQHYVIVKPIQPITPCDGTLPGIPKGYRLVGFGAVNEKQFYIDTVGTLKQGPAKHRLILEPIEDGPVNQPEVVEEYEIDLCGETAWTPSSFHPLPTGISPGYTGRTRKVVVQ